MLHLSFYFVKRRDAGISVLGFLIFMVLWFLVFMVLRNEFKFFGKEGTYARFSGVVSKGYGNFEGLRS